ncbi:MAG: 6-phosphogluconolactonase [Breznakibacter sp.]
MGAFNYQVFDDKNQLARYFANILKKKTGNRDKVYLAISGGSTPQHIFDVMANEFANDIAWDKLFVFWVDERCVPPAHAESNYRMTYVHLLSKVPIPASHIFRVKTELGNQEALQDYISTINTHVPKHLGIPRFDLTVLGMGDDGHTASIFPHEIQLWHSPDVCTLGHHPQSGQVRVTLTGKIINHSEQIIFLVTGSNKSEKLKEIFGNSDKSTAYPASMVDMAKTTWLVDAEAAKLLTL